jgi:hypothetical protein
MHQVHQGDQDDREIRAGDEPRATRAQGSNREQEGRASPKNALAYRTLILL